MSTRQMASEYRMAQWAEVMRKRKNSGQNIRTYCRESGIKEHVYYYWQKKLRDATIKELPDKHRLLGLTRSSVYPILPKSLTMKSIKSTENTRTQHFLC